MFNPDFERLGEINVAITGRSSKDCKRIMQTAYNLLDPIVGLRVTSMFLVSEQHVPRPGEDNEDNL